MDAVQVLAILAIIIAVIGCIVAVLRQEFAALIVALAVIALAIYPAVNSK